MWTLDRPNTADVKEQLDAALGEVAAGHALSPSAAEKNALWEIYAVYELLSGRPSPTLVGTNLRVEFLNLVRDAYGQVQERGRLSDLRNSLKLGAEECPYCGFGPIEDLDHHLQKAIYKLLSIFPLNLVPSCATCNRMKPKKVSVDPAKHLLNVYLEDLTQHDFFVATASMATSGALDLRFEIVDLPNVSSELCKRLRHHLEQFQLQRRLRAQINLYLAGLEISFRDSFASEGADGVETFLKRSAEANAKRFGRNDWRAVALTGLAACRDFCDGGFVKALGKP